jgi:hypothetical protein
VPQDAFSFKALHVQLPAPLPTELLREQPPQVPLLAAEWWLMKK